MKPNESDGKSVIWRTKRILDFALTLVGQPEFLILDEPTTAMDIETREHFWRMINFIIRYYVFE